MYRFGSVDELTMSTHSLLLCIILATAVFTDCREHRIPNWLVCLGLLLGLSYSALLPSQSVTFTDALLGLLVGFSVLLPGYMLGKMGAGDVKLMAACGCFLGAAGIFNAALMTFIAGGFLGLLWVLLDWLSTHHFVQANSVRYFSSTSNTLASEGEPQSTWKRRFPYATAIAVGCMTVLLTEFSVFTA